MESVRAFLAPSEGAFWSGSDITIGCTPHFETGKNSLELWKTVKYGKGSSWRYLLLLLAWKYPSLSLYFHSALGGRQSSVRSPKVHPPQQQPCPQQQVSRPLFLYEYDPVGHDPAVSEGPDIMGPTVDINHHIRILLPSQPCRPDCQFMDFTTLRIPVHIRFGEPTFLILPLLANAKNGGYHKPSPPTTVPLSRFWHTKLFCWWLQTLSWRVKIVFTAWKYPRSSSYFHTALGGRQSSGGSCQEHLFQQQPPPQQQLLQSDTVYRALRFCEMFSRKLLLQHSTCLGWTAAVVVPTSQRELARKHGTNPCGQ